MLSGKSASSGIAIARAFLLQSAELELETMKASDIDAEILRLEAAVASAKRELDILYQHALAKMGEEEASIFEAHALMLQDPELIANIHSEIRENSSMASLATAVVAKRFVAMFEAMDSEYLRERALDVQDVCDRLIRKILNVETVDIRNLPEDAILVARDITPSQMTSIELNKVLGIVTETGGKTSHTAIMARTLELPAVVGLTDACKLILAGDLLVVDGETGEVHVNPDPETLRTFQHRREMFLLAKQELLAVRDLVAETTDGRGVHLEANIASPLDLEAVRRNGGDGIGLFRTEFIFMDRDRAPDEEEQYTVYKKVLEGMPNKSVVIRTLDVGGDKHLPYLKIPDEENPFLGYRAIRYCLKDTALFKTQLRALLRASVFGDLSIMFPMISGLAEITAAKLILEECRQELAQQRMSTGEVRIGIMIEIPSAALMADQLARHVDFFSIGTNDLIQYVCAVDRMNENVQTLYDPFHPGVLRLIQHVISAGEKQGIDVAMCGEMAANEALTEILLGMGLKRFSMAPGSLLRVRKMIRELNFTEARNKAQTVLNMASGEEIKAYLSS